jgi:pectate lyase
MADEISPPLFGHSTASERREALHREEKRTKMIAGLCILTVVVVIVIWIAMALVQKLNPDDQPLHQHATNAATVMDNQPAGATGDDLARSVTGTGSDDIITVLSASGTRRNGEVLLRIEVTVKQSGGLASTDQAVGCFDYAFDYSTSPNEVSCPNEPPLRLPPPPPSTTTTVS